MIYIHNDSIYPCIKHAMVLIENTYNESKSIKVMYLNATNPDKLFNIFNTTSLSNNESVMRNFVYERIDNINSLILYLQEIKTTDDVTKTMIIIEGLETILLNGLGDYLEKNLALVTLFKLLNKMERGNQFITLILDKKNNFFLLHCLEEIPIKE